MRQIELYTDGSCSPNPGLGAYVSLMICRETREYKLIKEIKNNISNNEAELAAVILGLKSLKERSKVIVFTDSYFVIRPYTEGHIERWRKKNFRKLLCKVAWKELDQLIQVHDVSFNWVQGHGTNIYNRFCDRLCRKQIRQYNKNNKVKV